MSKDDISLHPEPDLLGRFKCVKCGEFTASKNKMHLWCEVGFLDWLNRFDKFEA